MCLPPYIVFCASYSNVFARGLRTSALIANIIVLNNPVEQCVETDSEPQVLAETLTVPSVTLRYQSWQFQLLKLPLTPHRNAPLSETGYVFLVSEATINQKGGNRVRGAIKPH